MRYFVVSEDGSTYGPAEVDLLNEWVKEGRLLPGMTLEEEGTRHRVAAGSVAGLDFYVLNEPASAGAGAAAIAMPYEPPIQESVAFDLFLAWAAVPATLILAAFRPIFGYLAIPIALLGIMAAIKVKERRHPAAAPAVVVNVLALVIWVAARVYMLLQ